MSNLFNKYNGDILKFSENLDKIIENSINSIIQPNFKIPTDIKKIVVANRRDLKLSIKEYFSFIGLSVETEDIPTREEGGNNQFQESIMFSNLRNTTNEVKLLIATLPQVGADGVILNSVGLPKIVDFGVAYNKVLEAVGGSQHWGEDKESPYYKVSIMAKLEELAKKDPSFKRLINRLNALQGFNKVKIQSSFRQSFSINKYSFVKWFIDFNGSRFIESNQSRVVDRLRERVDAAYKLSEFYLKGKQEFDKTGRATQTNQEIYDLIQAVDGGSRTLRESKFKELMAKLGFDKEFNREALWKDNTGAKRDLLQSLKDIFVNNNKSNEFIFELADAKMGRFSNALKFQAKQTNEHFEPQHVNPEGKNVYEYSLNNYYSYVANILNDAARLGGQVGIDYMYEYLPHFKTLEGTSDWLTQIKNGIISGKLNLDIVFLEGMEDGTSYKDGAVTYDLSPSEIILMHIEAAANYSGHEPIFTFRRPSDKSLEPGIRGFNSKQWDTDLIASTLVRYLTYDLKTSGKDSEGNSALNIFSTFLKDSTLKKVKMLKDGQNANVYKQEILRDFLEYLDSQTKDTLDLLDEYQITWANFSPEIKDHYTAGKVEANEALRRLVRDFVLNYFISRVEQHQMFLGDFTQYKQLFKRTSGPTGTGKTFNDSESLMNFITEDYVDRLANLPMKQRLERRDLLLKLNNKQLETLGLAEFNNSLNTRKSVNVSVLNDKIFKLGDNYFTKAQRDAFEMVIKDSMKHIKNDEYVKAKVKQYMAEYDKMNIADGLGYISFEQYREWLSKSGDWSPEQEAAYKKVVRGQRLSPEEMAYFPIIKPQGFGPRNYTMRTNGTKVDYDTLKTFFAKLSLAPLIPQAFEGLELEALAKSMQKSGVTIAIHESGLKNEFERSYHPINDFNGEEMPLSFFNTSNSFWKIQVDIHPEVEEADIDGTQQRKNLWLDLFSGSLPKDYNGTRASWVKLNEAEKRANSRLYTLYQEYKEVYKNLIAKERANFLKELTINPVTFEIKDYEVFAKEIRKEIASRRLPSNILDAVKPSADGKSLMFPIDALPIADKVENILFARAVNNTIKLKRPGGAYVQTSNAYYKTSKKFALSKDSLTPEQLAKAEMFAKELEFIEPIYKDGKLTEIRAAQVYLPNYMRSIIGDVTDLSTIDPKLLNLVSYRIPNSGQNFMLPLRVKGFLPAEMGDTVIVPYAIVAQAGSDFDIDKLHIFRPNFKPLFDAKNEAKWIGVIKEINTTLSEAGELSFRFKESVEGIEELNDYIEYLNSLGNEFTTNAEKIVFNIVKSVSAEAKEVVYINGKIDGNKKELQNKLMEIQLEILTSPYVARNMIVPNGAPTLKDEAAYTEYLRNFYSKVFEIKGKISELRDSKKVIEFFEERGVILNDRLLQAIHNAYTSEINYSDTTEIYQEWRKLYNDQIKKDRFDKLLSFRHEIETGQAFKGGKQGVGIVANYATFHTLCQSLDIPIKDTMVVKARVISGGKESTLTTNNPVKYNYKHTGRYGSVFNIDGELISEEFAEHLTANVDIAKDPFIFKLNTNSMTSNIKYMMIAQGAGVKFADRFLTQPIIMDYVKQKTINDSMIVESTRKDRKNTLYRGKEEMLSDILNFYGIKVAKDKVGKYLQELHEASGELTLDTLTQNIISPVGKTQAQVLADFIAYMDYAKEFSNIVSAIKPDTARIKNNSEATAIIENIDRALETKFIDPVLINSLLNDTVLSGFSNSHAKFYKSIYKEQFVTESDDIQNAIYNIIKEDVKLNKQRLSEKEVDKIRQGIMTYLLQVALNYHFNTMEKPFTREQLEKMMVGKNSVARNVYVATADNTKQEIKNRALEFLFAKLSAESDSQDLVKTTGKKIDPITADLISEGFELLSQQNPPLYNMLVQINAAQVGYNFSPISLLKYFNATQISSIFAPILKKAKGDLGEIVNIQEFLDNFYSANRKNSKFVPYVSPGYGKTELRDNNNILKVEATNNNSGRKFLRSSDNKSKEVKGKNKTVKQDILWKRIGFDSTGAAYYIKTNVKSTFFSQEYHSDFYSFNGENESDNNRIDKKTYNELMTKYSNLTQVNESLPNKVESSQEIYDAAFTDVTNEYSIETTLSGAKVADLLTKQEWDSMTVEEKDTFKKCN